MVSVRQSLPLRQSQALPGSPPRGALGLPPSPGLALAAALVLSACGQRESAATNTDVPKPIATSDAQIERAVEDALTSPGPSTSTKSDVQAGLKAQAEEILAKYPNKNAQDLLTVPEVVEAFKAGMTKLSKDKKLLDQLKSTAGIVAEMKGLSSEPGTFNLNFDIKSYDHVRKSRLLQAVLSEDPKQIVRFMTEEIGEAVPELSFEGAERASNGVSIKANPPPAQ